MTTQPHTGSSVLKAIFSRTFVAIALINFLGMTGYYAIFVVNTQFAVSAFNCSLAYAGLLTGIVVIGCLVGRFFSGRIVNSVGYKQLLFAGLALYFVSNLAYLAVSSTWMLLIVRFLSGAAIGIIGTVAGTLVAVITPKAFQGRGISYYSMSTALAICSGPFIGIAFVGKIGYTGIFWVSIALSAVSLALWLLVRVNEKPKAQTKKKIELSDFIDVRLIPFCLVCAIFCLAWGNIQAFMAPYSHVFHVEAAASFFFLVYAAAILLTRPMTGKMYDLHGPAIVFYPVIISLILGLVILWALPSSIGVLVAGALCGLGFGNITSIGNASAVAMVPRERYAQATSSFFIFFDLGIGAAPYLSGYLVPTFGYDGVFGITAAACAVGLPLYYLVTRGAKKPSKGEELEFNKELEDITVTEEQSGDIPVSQKPKS